MENRTENFQIHQCLQCEEGYVPTPHGCQPCSEGCNLCYQGREDFNYTAYLVLQRPYLNFT